MKRKQTFFMLGFLLFALGFNSWAQPMIRYVSLDAEGDGSSWQSASNDLQAMIDASKAGDEVWVSTGVYKAQKLIDEKRNRSYAFILKDGVSLYGGFEGKESTKEERKLKPGGQVYDWLYETILSADDDVPDEWVRGIDAGTDYRYAWQISGNERNANHILYCKEKLNEPTIIEGFVLEGAYADTWQVDPGGAALRALGHVELHKSIVRRNVAKNKVELRTYYGGAISLRETDGKAVVADCLLEDNQVSASYEVSRGGGIYNDGGTISRCLFRACVSFDEGGAISNVGGGLVEDCEILDCYSGSGGGIYNEGTVRNVRILDCRALNGGGINNKGGLVHHSIIANCFADTNIFGENLGGSGGGIYNTAGKIVGSLVYNCTSFVGGGVEMKSGTIYHSTVQSSSVRKKDVAANIGLAEGARLVNSIVADDVNVSEFVKATSFRGVAKTKSDTLEIINASWMLAKGSGFIDTGENTTEVVEETDLAGNERIMGAAIDRGAYEFEDTSAKEANIIMSFANIGNEVLIECEAAEGASFQIDWGDGTLVSYEGRKAITQRPAAETVKIFGENIIALKVLDQGLETLDIQRAASLRMLQIGSNLLTKLDVRNNVALVGLYCENNKISELDVKTNSRLRVLDCHANKIEGVLDCSALVALTKLDCSGNMIADLLFPTTVTLTDVDCGGNQLTSLKLEGLTELSTLVCNNNELEQLDLSANTKLDNLYCPENTIRELDLTANVLLRQLTAGDNQLQGIDISNNSILSGLYLQNNFIEELDMEQISTLEWVNVEHNELNKMLLGEQPSLRMLNAAHNMLQEINIDKSPLINTLHVGNNELTGLNVNKQNQLIWLSCDSNQIATLDLSSNPSLSWLECESNKLDILQLSAQKHLQKLYAGYNLLTALDLSGNKEVQGVLIQGNMMGVEAIGEMIAQLGDVSSVEIHDNNRLWCRQLNISYMPGTANVDVSGAELKGWIVTAERGTGVATSEGARMGLRYIVEREVVVSDADVDVWRVYGLDGACLLTRRGGNELSFQEFPAATFIVTATMQNGLMLSTKIMR